MQYVDRADVLDALCAGWAAATPIAVDTEFERSVTYRPRPALIQLADAQSQWLVDPTAIDDLTSLGTLIGRSEPVKLMHSALEDLTVLELATGQVPEAVFDTQLAAAFAGIGFGMGYHALVRDLLAVDLPKDQTRSNWLKRPLSDAQLAYARDDVAHLDALHGILSTRLAELGRCDWLAEETALVFARARENEGERDFLRLARRAGDDDQLRGVLGALVHWRDREASQRNRPRRHLLDDDLLVELARSRPADPKALRSLPAWSVHRGRAGIRDLLAAVVEAGDAAPCALPSAATDLSPYKTSLDRAKRIVAEVARTLGMEPALLAPRRLLEKALIHLRIERHGDLPREFQGWRGPLLADSLKECLGGG